MPRSLHGIGMKINPGLSRNFTDFADGLYRADFIVRMHDGYQYCFICDRLSDAFRINQSVFIHR